MRLFGFQLTDVRRINNLDAAAADDSNHNTHSHRVPVADRRASSRTETKMRTEAPPFAITRCRLWDYRTVDVPRGTTVKPDSIDNANLAVY